MRVETAFESGEGGGGEVVEVDAFDGGSEAGGVSERGDSDWRSVRHG